MHLWSVYRTIVHNEPWSNVIHVNFSNLAMIHLKCGIGGFIDINWNWYYALVWELNKCPSALISFWAWLQKCNGVTLSTFNMLCIHYYMHEHESLWVGDRLKQTTEACQFTRVDIPTTAKFLSNNIHRGGPISIYQDGILINWLVRLMLKLHFELKHSVVVS